MRALVRSWQMYQARRCTPDGNELYEIGRTSQGRPILVGAFDWRLAKEDREYRRRLIAQSAEVLGEEERCHH